MAFWIALIVCSAFIIYVAFKQSQARPQQSIGSTASGSDSRIFVDVDVAYFANLYRTHSTAQADIAMQSYTGKWLKQTAGTVSDVRHDQFLGSDIAYVTVSVPTKDSLKMYVILAKFSESPFRERALVLNRGEQVNLMGKIGKGDDMGLVLEDCEIVP